MDKKSLLKKIEVLNYEWNVSDSKESIKQLEEIESLCEEYLKHYPNDTDILKRLAMTLHTVPLADDYKAVECLKKVVEMEKNDIYALAALLELEWLAYGKMDPKDCLKLYEIATSDPEELSIVEYLKATYLEQEKMSVNEYVTCLQKSIDLYPYHVNNWIKLGRYMIANNRENEGLTFVRRGYENIKKVYKENQLLDITSVKDFVSEFITGTESSDVWVEFLKKDLKDISNIGRNN